MTDGLLSPLTGRPLRPAGPSALADGHERWPVVDGIPFLRVGRDGLRAAALAALDAGRPEDALAVLLADQDDFAPVPPPPADDLRALVDGAGRGAVNLREAMAALRFGPVAHYFALRPSAPTFLSGLGLLAQYGPPGPAGVVEVACGVGQFLRELAARDVRAAGVDVVFAKLWLARRFVVPEAELVCADVAAGVPLAARPGATVFCHDAFYFLPTKEAVAAEMARLAGPGGRVLIGHAHNARVDHGVAGTPRTPEGYAALLPGAALHDDAELAEAHLTDRPAPRRTTEELAGVEAVALAWAEGGLRGGWWPALGLPPPGTPLRLNPLLADAGGTLRPAWPEPRFAAEYANAGYLEGEPVPPPEVLAAAAAGTGRWPEVDRLARKRILLDVPEGW